MSSDKQVRKGDITWPQWSASGEAPSCRMCAAIAPYGKTPKAAKRGSSARLRVRPGESSSWGYSGNRGLINATSSGSILFRFKKNAKIRSWESFAKPFFADSGVALVSNRAELQARCRVWGGG